MNILILGGTQFVGKHIVYETLNLASLKSLPILFICENNRYSVHTNIAERTLTNNFKDKVRSFEIKYHKI